MDCPSLVMGGEPWAGNRAEPTAKVLRTAGLRSGYARTLQSRRNGLFCGICRQSGGLAPNGFRESESGGSSCRRLCNPGQLIVTPAALLRRRDTNRNQRRIGGRSVGPAGCAALAKDLGGIASRTAIGRHQNLIILALHSAPGGAIRFQDPHASAGPRRAGRAGGSLRPLGSRRTGRTGRAHRADITLRTGRTGIALRSLAARSQAAGEAHQQYRCECQMPCTHFQDLPNSLEKERKQLATLARHHGRATPQQKIKPRARAQGRCRTYSSIAPRPHDHALYSSAHRLSDRRPSSQACSKSRRDCGRQCRARAADCRRHR